MHRWMDFYYSYSASHHKQQNCIEIDNNCVKYNIMCLLEESFRDKEGSDLAAERRTFRITLMKGTRS